MKAVLISIRPEWCAKICSGVKTIEVRKANGEVIGEFVCDCITPLYNVCMDDWKRLAGGLHNIEKELVNQACLTEAKLHTYAGGKNCFAWHISDLEIYEQPRKLEEFAGIRTMKNGFELRLLDRAPQSWCYVAEGQR